MGNGKPEPIHQPGTLRGEDVESAEGQEPGRKEQETTGAGRPARKATPRFSTGINPDDRKPVDPNSTYLPPP